MGIPRVRLISMKPTVTLGQIRNTRIKIFYNKYIFYIAKIGGRESLKRILIEFGARLVSFVSNENRIKMLEKPPKSIFVTLSINLSKNSMRIF